MKKRMYATIGLIIIIIFASVLLAGRNDVVNAYEDVELAKSKVQIMLQWRSDLIPDLVSTVKAYAEHKEAIFAEIDESWTKFVNSISIFSVNEIVEADTKLTQEINKLLILAESYPDLKVSDHFLVLQYEIVSSENRINIGRIEYNEAVTKYNKYVETFPGYIFAKLWKYDEIAHFADEPEAPKTPDTRFD